MLGIQKAKHRVNHARKLLTYALVGNGSLADVYFAIDAYLTAEKGVDRFREQHQRISERDASRKCVSCHRFFSYDDTREHCRQHWTKCTMCAWTTE